MQPAVASHFSPQCDEPLIWAGLMRDAKGWHDIAHAFFFTVSVLDGHARIDGTSSLSYTCGICSKSVSTRRAQLQHQRMSHGWRDPINKFIDGSGVCPCCKSVCFTRLRVLAHVTDKRRKKCRDTLLLGSIIPPLPPKEIDRLDDFDRDARNEFRKLGRSHAIACGSARTAEGHVFVLLVVASLCSSACIFWFAKVVNASAPT